jgi:hypothetical protein
MHGKTEKCIQHFDQKLQVKRLSGIPRCKWEDIIKTYLMRSV